MNTVRLLRFWACLATDLAVFVLQLILNGIINGAQLALIAIGLTLVFAVLRFANFAIGSLATIGAFAGWWVNTHFGMPAPLALLAAFLVAGLFGAISHQLVLKPMLPYGLLATAIVSIALSLVLENIVRFGFGNDLRSYDLPLARDWRFWGLRIGPQQIENLALAGLSVGALFLLLAFSRIGKAMRAVADNPVLANLKGIDPNRIALVASATGAGLAGMGGMLVGLDSTIDPLTGFRVILPAFAAIVVGGLGSVPGAVLGAMIIGIGEELSFLILPPAYKIAVGFFAILIVLTFRPNGLLGQKA
jgi:branched-chain amino acid transport system permease protein